MSGKGVSFGDKKIKKKKNLKKKKKTTKKHLRYMYQ